MIGRASVRKKDMDTDGQERCLGVKIVLSLKLQAVTANVVNPKVNFEFCQAQLQLKLQPWLKAEIALFSTYPHHPPTYPSKSTEPG